MALLNLLKASYTQKLGETYGAAWKGKAVIKAAPFSKAPPSPLQTANVRAFEALNRLSSAIAGIGFANTGLDASKIHKHNSVAKFLKPAIKNHSFEPSNIKESIPEGTDLSITAFNFNHSTKILTISLDLSPNFIYTTGKKVFLLVFDSLGSTFHDKLLHPAKYSYAFYLDPSDSFTYYAMAFLSTPVKRGYRLDNLVLQETRFLPPTAVCIS